MIQVAVNGTPYTDFVEEAVTVSLESLANDFSFTASAVGGFPPLRQRDVVVVTVDGDTVLTGAIDEIAGRDQEGDHLITYTGRDKTGDLLDSQINVLDDIRAADNLTLKRIIEIVIKHLGLSLKVVDNLNPAPFNKAEDIIAPKVGQNAFEFIAAFAAKRQALLSSTGDGDVLITQSSPTDSGATVQRLKGADSNNILTQSWALNASLRFNKYIYRGQLDPSALNFGGESDSTAVEDQGGEAIDSGIRVGRQSVTVESDVSVKGAFGAKTSMSYSSEQLKDRAKWAKQLALAKANRFTCTVKGHQKPNDGVWQANTLIQVNSDTADINRKMLINTLTFSQGEGRPTVTTLECVERNVYTINEKILAQRPTGSQNDAFQPIVG
jgi:prophage tail gpP-like protein